METTKLKLNAEWTPDCSGKQDYDGEILSISTRYWPAHYQSNKKVSANCSLMLRFKGYPEYKHLLEKSFEAETESELKAQVEKYAQKQFERVVWAAEQIEHFPWVLSANRIALIILGASFGLIVGILIGLP